MTVDVFMPTKTAEPSSSIRSVMQAREDKLYELEKRVELLENRQRVLEESIHILEKWRLAHSNEEIETVVKGLKELQMCILTGRGVGQHLREEKECVDQLGPIIESKMIS